MTADNSAVNVIRISDIGWVCIIDLFQASGLVIERVGIDQEIPGSHWGEEEAGLIQYKLYARDDTPVHSVLHEASHWLLMSEERRAQLHTDAKGTALEESAACYLQLLLADLIPAVGMNNMFSDMDTWGYSFRSGCTKNWFETDAEDALAYLTQKLPHSHGIPGLHIPSP